jgi:hypothetical protein
MHKLTKDRMRWGRYAILAGMLVGIWALSNPALARTAEAVINPFPLIILGSLCRVVAGVTVVARLQGIQEQPGREAAISLSAGMTSLVLFGPCLALAIGWVLLPLWPVFPLIPMFLALWLLRILVRMRQWKTLRVGLIALTGTAIAAWGWLWLLSVCLSDM